MYPNMNSTLNPYLVIDNRLMAHSSSRSSWGCSCRTIVLHMLLVATVLHMLHLTIVLPSCSRRNMLRGFCVKRLLGLGTNLVDERVPLDVF